MRSTSLFIAALLLAVGVPAHAQLFSKADSVLAALTARASGESTWHLGLGGGVSMPLTDARTAFQDGYNGLAYLAWLPRGPLGLRFTATADRHLLKGSTAGRTATGTVAGGLGGIVIRASTGVVRPYITIGAGAFQVMTEVNGTRTETIKFGVDSGLGMQLHFGAVAAFVEGRFQNLFDPPRAAVDPRAFEQMESQIVPVTFGFQF